MENILLSIVAGLILIMFALIWWLEKHQVSKCPRCGKPWKKSNNEADDTFMCKCGMTTYDRHKFDGTFEERSKNY